MGDRTQWRVSSTMFAMFRNDANVGPLEAISHLHSTNNAFGQPKVPKEYQQNFTAHQLLMQELDAVGLSAATSVKIGEAQPGTEAAPAEGEVPVTTT